MNPRKKFQKSQNPSKNEKTKKMRGKIWAVVKMLEKVEN